MPPPFQARAGLIGLAAGVLGALSALLLLVWPPQVAVNLVSYPFTPNGFYAAQAWFFVQHLGLLLAMVALAQSGAVGRSLMTRTAVWAAVAGMVALTLAELLAMRYATWDDEAAYAGLMGTAYGASVNVIGLGMLIAGIGVLRAGVWSGRWRWAPLAIGIAAFAVVTPGMFGGFVIARLAIGFWMLLFGALGWALYVESRRLASPRVEHGSDVAPAPRDEAAVPGSSHD
jgi:hypothetical protein